MFGFTYDDSIDCHSRIRRETSMHASPRPAVRVVVMASMFTLAAPCPVVVNARPISVHRSTNASSAVVYLARKHVCGELITRVVGWVIEGWVHSCFLLSLLSFSLSCSLLYISISLTYPSKARAPSIARPRASVETS